MDFLFSSADKLRTTVTADQRDGIDYFDLTIDYGKEVVPSPVKITFHTPMTDTASVWSPMGYHHEVMPNWMPHTCDSRLTGGMPLIALVTESGESRVTAALSDAKSDIRFTVGVVEEDGTAEWTIVLFRTPAAPRRRYSLTLRFDTRELPLSETVADVSRFWEGQYVPMPAPDAAFEPLFSTWYNFHQRISPAALLEEVRAAKELGFGTVIVDDGWQCTDSSRGYAYTGDWEVQPEKLGTGRDFSDACHALGMRIMLWYSVPYIGVHAGNFARFEGKYLRLIAGGQWAVLDPRYREVRDFLVGLYRDAMVRYDLDGLKLDFINEFRFTDGAALPCPDMDIPVLEDATERLMCDIRRAVTEIKPDALIEFRQPYVGPVVRSFGNMFRVADCPYAANSNLRAIAEMRLASAGTAIHSDMLMWHPETSPEDVARHLLATLFAVPQISVLLKQLSPAHRLVLTRYLAYREENAAVLREGTFQCDPPYRCDRMWVTAQDKQIVAVYHGNSFRATPLSTDVFFAVGGEVLLDLGGASRLLTVYDCFGTVLSHTEASGLLKLRVPDVALVEIR